jgi:hypothetical protein
MSIETILALKDKLCQGACCRIPPMTVIDLAILLNEVAFCREQIHGPNLPH